MKNLKVKDLKEGQLYKLNTRQRKWRVCTKLLWLTEKTTHPKTWKGHLNSEEHILIIAPNCGQTMLKPNDEVLIDE